ncbi:PREDICTED: protein starmaker-like [Priapulus caudatus]|uniref:Protein starmaker-like n=1 Tax=Priapulus caudatus TaxID=37621 RepID=A0ABM1EC77_PRICU|nr:PREDICTED: protein starmaker-like [Priapulus caudatus]
MDSDQEEGEAHKSTEDKMNSDQEEGEAHKSTEDKMNSDQEEGEAHQMKEAVIGDRPKKRVHQDGDNRQNIEMGSVSKEIESNKHLEDIDNTCKKYIMDYESLDDSDNDPDYNTDADDDETSDTTDSEKEDKINNNRKIIKPKRKNEYREKAKQLEQKQKSSNKICFDVISGSESDTSEIFGVQGIIERSLHVLNTDKCIDPEVTDQKQDNGTSEEKSVDLSDSDADELSVNEDEIVRDINCPGIFVKKILRSESTKLGKKKKCSPQDADDEEELGTPSNAIKLSHNIRRLASAKLAFAIKQGNEPKRRESKDFLTLIKLEWTTKLARVTLETRKFNSKKPLPLPQDVLKLANFNKEELEKLDLNDASYPNYRKVVTLTETRLILYNRRRCGELQAMQ